MGARAGQVPASLRAFTSTGGVVLVEVRVKSLGLDRASNTPVVILEEMDGERVLPIWIGPGEASAIAMHLADMKFSRPLTHDLILEVLKGMGGRLSRVVITKVADSTYFAELVIQRGGGTVSVDARPSDSIAVALRTDARIFASDSLLERASIEISEEEVSPTPPKPVLPQQAPPSHAEGPKPEQPIMSAEELKEHLRRLNPEDFGRFTP